MANTNRAIHLTEKEGMEILAKYPDLESVIVKPGKRRPRIKAKSKYRNVKTEVDGILFDSGKEARRYSELKLMQAAGHIHDLELQVRYKIVVNKIHICDYICDFQYVTARGTRVVEDVKGYRPATYRLKRSLMMAVLGIQIKET